MGAKNTLRILRDNIGGQAMHPKISKWMVLPALLFIGQVGALELSTLEHINVRGESHASRLNSGDGCKQVGGNAFDPMRDGRVNAMKSGENGGAEGGAGICSSRLVPVTPSDVATKAGQQERAKNGVDVGDEGFNHWWWLYAVAVSLFPIFTTMHTDKKHNEAVQKPC